MNPVRTDRLMIMLAVLAATCSTPRLARADDTGFYVAASAGVANVQYDASTFYASSNDVGYQFAAGFRPLPIFSAEIAYTGFPRAFSGINYADTYGIGAFGVGYLPLSILDIYGKVGVVDWRTSAHQVGYYSFDNTGANVAYGGGVSKNWGQFGARVEYERFNIPRSSQMQLTSIGLVWTF